MCCRSKHSRQPLRTHSPEPTLAAKLLRERRTCEQLTPRGQPLPGHRFGRRQGEGAGGCRRNQGRGAWVPGGPPQCPGSGGNTASLCSLNGGGQGGLQFPQGAGAGGRTSGLPSGRGWLLNPPGTLGDSTRFPGVLRPESGGAP